MTLLVFRVMIVASNHILLEAYIEIE
jgi:hypothetical protein